LRSSSGTSTVILRAVSIVCHHTILKTSTEYGIFYSPSRDDFAFGHFKKFAPTESSPKSISFGPGRRGERKFTPANKSGDLLFAQRQLQS
jgi:hypothetical protein